MTHWNKQLYRATLLLSFLGINALILIGIGAVLGYLNTGAERSSILHLGVALEQVYLPNTSWDTLDNEGRKMEEQTLDDIEDDFLRAWYVRSVALKNNDPFGLDDYYTESMRNNVKSLIGINSSNNSSISSTALNHKLHLDFYSADGKLVSFTDSMVTEVHEVYTAGKLVNRYTDITSYRVIMLLEDGFWRIRHLLTLDHKLDPNKPETSPKKFEDISECRGINYYPGAQAWRLFDQELDKRALNEDFELLRSNGLNTLRIFIPYSTFGKAKISKVKLERLVEFMDLAGQYKLQVLVTLFDFYGNYDLPDWTLTHRHAEGIVRALRDHPALLGWDIKNEPDLDFESRGKERVLSWLSEMINQVKSWDPNHPVTIGWSNPKDAIELNKEVDFISFHYYEDPADFTYAIEALKKNLGEKEILLEEFGYSSYSGMANLWIGSEAKQKEYFMEMKSALIAEEIPSLFWTLHDFEEIPNEVVGRLPWRKARQKYFGFIRSDGSKKPAFEYLNNK